MSSRKGWHLIFCMEKICSFFGHREVEITDRLYSAVFSNIMNALEQGFCSFYFGGYGEFDALCHQIVTKIKQEKPEFKISRKYCVTKESYLRKDTRYFKREDYDEIIYLPLSFEGWYKSIYFRNCAMIDRSDLIVFYAENRERSGAYKAYKYAKSKKGKTVINLWGK